MQAAIKAFASHNWGSDALNHKRVVKLCTVLRERGIDVWLDETHMKGNILDAMCKGIDESVVQSLITVAASSCTQAKPMRRR